jgi:hypothetical protein
MIVAAASLRGPLTCANTPTVTNYSCRNLAAPPPAQRPPSPPTLEHLRRDNTMITTNYSCRISGRLVCIAAPVNSLVTLLVKPYAYRHG